jgi:hypothetical protein
MYKRKKNRMKAKRKGRRMILKTAKNQTGYLYKVKTYQGCSYFHRQ